MSKQRVARCNCGKLSVETQGEPAWVSACSCQACQRRTGAPFGVMAFFPMEQLSTAGNAKPWKRPCDSTNEAVHHFCSNCGSTVYVESQATPGTLAIAVGCFTDPDFPQPQFAAWGEHRHNWIAFPEGCREVEGQDFS